MKSFSYLLSTLAVTTSTLAAPLTSGTTRDLDCSQYDPVTSYNWVVNPDQWGTDSSTTCVQILSASETSISWSAQWSWPNGGTNIKSYPNVELNNWDCKPLSSYSSIQSSWNWDYNTAPVSADVSYDAFIADNSCSNSHKAEIMIWLAAYNLQPISDSGANPHTSNAVSGWDLYVGTNSQTGVPAYSFVAQGSPVKSYNGDLMTFFKYLQNAGLIDGNEFLQELHAGTEPASGTNEVFTTSSFTLANS